MILCEHDIQQKKSVMSFGIGYVRLLMNERNEPEDFIFEEINPAFEKLTGWNKEEVTGTPASGFTRLSKAGMLYWLSLYSTVRDSDKTQETTQWIDELQKYITITAIPAEGDFVMIVIRESAEEAVSLAQDKETAHILEVLDPLFSNSRDAVSLLEYSSGKYFYVQNNSIHQKLTGVSNVRGMELSKLVGRYTGKQLQRYYEQCMITGRPVSYEQEFNFAPGKRIWQTEVSPIFGSDGIRYLLLLSKDISELKQMQKDNELLSRRLKSMFTQHSAIKLIYDPDSGHILDANPSACRFYGYRKDELCSMMVQDINMLPADKLRERFQSELAGGNYFSAVPYRLKNGEIRLLDVYSCPISDGDRKLIYSIIFDATDREIYRSALLKEKELLKTTLQSIGDGVVTTDKSGRITSLNNVAQELTGWDNSSAIGRPFTEVFILKNEETGETVENPIQKVLDTGRIIGLANHTELVRLDGQAIPIADSAAPIRTEDGQTAGVVMVFRDVSDEKKHNRQIEYLSYHDSLTGLYNRYYIERILNKLDTPENLPISVIMGDVNGLKIANDVFGHNAGDIMLQGVARLLEKNCGENGLIARWGGDEFVVFLPRTNAKTAERIIRNIKNAHIAINESGLFLSLSLGCASKESMRKDIQSVMRQAEEYMYHQKLLDSQSYRNSIINTLLATLYEKSNETEEHSKRLEKYCHCVGRELQLSSKEMDELSLLSLLHDIGKVSIDPAVLQKTGPLTSSEWEEMKHHPEIGYRIAQATPELATVSHFILSHHERWDGKGYPQGLKQKEIPLICRILAPVDAFDAMTNDRVYRKAMSTEEALLELERNSGIQFDPIITKILIKAIETEKEAGSIL